MPRPRGPESSTICFRLTNESRDLLLAAAYDLERTKGDASLDPDEVNVSDLIRRTLDEWAQDYAAEHGGEEELKHSFLEARADFAAARAEEARARFDATRQVARGTRGGAGAAQRARQSAKSARAAARPTATARSTPAATSARSNSSKSEGAASNHAEEPARHR